MAEQALFITLEGIDGAGKSTHVATVADCLRSRQHRVVVTREPGGTELGERLRELVLAEAMHPDTEALLMFAARREHLARVILPALARGDSVVCDRFSDATFAYQGGGRGMDKTRLAVLERWVHPDFQPHLTLLFDIDPQTARNRLAGARAADRFEAEQGEFFRKVRAAYLERAAASPGRFRIMDATHTPEEVKNMVEQYVASYC